MSARRRFSALVLLVGLLLPTSTISAQGRKLGPDTAKSIQEAKLDPTFQTTRIERIALVPLLTTGDDKDAVVIISKNLVAQLSQTHPEYTVVPPEEIMNFVTTSKLDDQFNMFFGDYSSAGTLRQDFVDVLRGKLRVDAILLGTITAYGEAKSTGRITKWIPGKKNNVIGLEMGLYRTSDGRRIWSGKDAIATTQSDDLSRAAEAIAEVFARFLGRRAY
jgi:hypothetical protein